MDKCVNEKIWGGIYMSVFNDSKKLLHSKFPLFFPVQSFRIHPFSHILILSLTFLPIISSSHFPIISEARAATYYVDATNGKDTSNGLSEATPWKTVAKVNASSFNPGDQILLKEENGVRLNPYSLIKSQKEITP
jgi:hypothetical protein